MILCLFMARDLRRRIFSTAIDHSARTATFIIGGMHCQACVTRLENAVLQVQGVLSANIQLKSSSATVAGEFDPREIIDAIQSAGYTVTDDS
jgi:copper chaperone CopZ